MASNSRVQIENADLKAKISAADINSVRVLRQNKTRQVEICTATEKVSFNVNISVKG